MKVVYKLSQKKLNGCHRDRLQPNFNKIFSFCLNRTKRKTKAVKEGI